MPPPPPFTDLATYKLCKNGSGCTGMFYRRAPAGINDPGRVSSNWPRDGALLAGEVVQAADGDYWLKCKFVSQAKSSSSSWEPIKYGYMPFKYAQYYLEEV